MSDFSSVFQDSRRNATVGNPGAPLHVPRLPEIFSSRIDSAAPQLSSPSSPGTIPPLFHGSLQSVLQQFHQAAPPTVSSTEQQSVGVLQTPTATPSTTTSTIPSPLESFQPTLPPSSAGNTNANPVITPATTVAAPSDPNSAGAAAPSLSAVDGSHALHLVFN